MLQDVVLENAPDGVVVIDENGIIILVNKEMENLFNHKRNEVVGVSIEVYIPERFKNEHVKLRNKYCMDPVKKAMGKKPPLVGRRKDGTEFPVEINIAPFFENKKLFIIGTVRNIAEKIKLEEKIQESLHEKEIMLKEIHHRVKNNLQITSSLLSLQSNYTLDEKLKNLLTESQNRIHTMALVHEKLYLSADMAKIKLADYVNSLTQLLFRSVTDGKNKITIEVSGNGTMLGIDTAVPCGLIINELVSNSLKHAFPDNPSGKIQIFIEEKKNEVIVTVSDNGIGFKNDFNLENIPTLGLKLVFTLIKQLKGKFEIKNKNGVSFKFSFFDEVLENE